MSLPSRICLSRGAIYFSDLDTNTVLEDALSLSRDFVSVSWSHVLKDGNVVAHHLARFYFVWC